MRSTRLIRAPNEFIDVLDRISKRRGCNRTEFLRESGTEIFENADYLHRIFGRMRKK